jgi:Uma2 family endonuclease
MAIAHSPITLEQFLALPEEEPALEYEDGRASQKASPKGHHSRLQVSLVVTVNSEYEPARVASAFSELRATFGGRSYVPDVSIYRWERIPRMPDGRIAQNFDLPPDIVVEIVSPGQSVTALVRRCIWYTQNGVVVALLVDPADER